MRRSSAHLHPAFTLIEILIVIVIIGLLVSILIPALAHAREAARTVVCMGNVKQIAAGYGSYALDYRGSIWETGNPAPIRYWYAQPQNPNFALGSGNPAVVGPAFGYLQNVDKIFECPTNKRRTPAKWTINPSDSVWSSPFYQVQMVLMNEFLSERALNFDYSMITGASGARTDTNTLTMFDLRAQQFIAQDRDLRASPPPVAQMKFFKSVPVFVEEDMTFHNAVVPDGMFSNTDQITNRHGRRGHISYITGDVELFEGPRGPNQESETDVGDLTGNDFWAKGLGGVWYKMCPSWPVGNRPYGWISQPR